MLLGQLHSDHFDNQSTDGRLSAIISSLCCCFSWSWTDVQTRDNVDTNDGTNFMRASSVINMIMMGLPMADDDANRAASHFGHKRDDE